MGDSSAKQHGWLWRWRRGHCGPAWLVGLLILVIAISSRSGTRTAAQSGTALLPGWNNVLYLGPGGPVVAELVTLQYALTGILHWDAVNQRWQVYYPSSSQPTDLTALLQGQVYWIDVQSPVVLPQQTAIAPAQQLAPGWNNVAYLGPGAPGSALIEQSQLWSWDASGQRWRFRDPAAPAASDFVAPTRFTVYWVFVGGPAGASLPAGAASPAGAATATPTPAPQASGCHSFTSQQPQVNDAADALTRAGIGALPSTGITMPSLRSGPDGLGPPQPFYIPPTILRAVAWVETAWHQASWDTTRGTSGPTLTSSTCAYGLMQILDGMTIAGNPTANQAAIASDSHANIAAGAAMLAADWNRTPDQLPYAGRHDPHILEDWYFALWAYHCFGPVCLSYGAHNNPDDPALTWPRPVYNSPDQLNSPLGLDYSDYPYEELVYGTVQYPPLVSGQPLWAPIPIQLPPHGSIGYPEPHAIGEPAAHLEDGSGLPPYTPPSSTPSPAPALTPTATASPPGMALPLLVPPTEPTPAH